MAVSLLDPARVEFPSPEAARQDGLLAVGGDLSPLCLLEAYRRGIFPWTDDPVTWWSPHPRAIFEIEAFVPPARAAAKLARGRFRLTFDRAFAEVMRGCAEPRPGREETWVSERFIAAYVELHRRGHAHSAEVWEDGVLVGGVYGVALGGFFAGESMFRRVNDASKAALIGLMARLRRCGFVLFDTQVATPLTRALGAVEIPRADYLRRLEGALALPVRFDAADGEAAPERAAAAG